MLVRVNHLARTSLLFVALLCAGCVGSLRAQNVEHIKRLDGTTITPIELDATVSRLMASAEVPGVALAIFHDGKTVYLKAYGVRDVETKRTLTIDTVMTGASWSKSVFAYMTMQLVDEGLLDLDKPIQEYLPKPLPEYRRYADLAGESRYQAITARMLLDHTSGLPNWRSLEDDRKLHIHFTPGSRFAYSGEGIDLLQLVVETVSKASIEEIARKRIFQPFDMSRSGYVWRPDFESDYANGYDEYGRSLGAERRTFPDAAGSLLTTPSDFAKFVAATMAGRSLSAKAKTEMLGAQIVIDSRREFPTLTSEITDANRKIRLSYGLGWGLYWSPIGKAYFKEGHDEGWRNYVVVFESSGNGMFVMTNSSNGEGIFEYLLEAGIGDRFTPIEWEGYTPFDKLPPRKPLSTHKRVAINPALLDRYVGRYGDPPKLLIIVKREDDHLSVQEFDNGSPENPQELQPESNFEFFSTTADDIYAFQTDAEGGVIGFDLRTGGERIPIKRLP